MLFKFQLDFLALVKRLGSKLIATGSRCLFDLLYEVSLQVDIVP